MPHDKFESNGVDLPWFSPVDETPLDDDIDVENYQTEQPVVTFEDALDAIQAEALAPMDLLGFSDMSRKQVHQLRSVWNGLADDKRATLAELAAMVTIESPYSDFGTFFLTLLDDPLESVRVQATLGAAQSENTNLIRPLVRLAEEDPSAEVRRNAVLALAQQFVGLEMGFVPDAQDRKALARVTAWAKDQSRPSELRAACLYASSHNTMDDETGSIIEQFVASDDETLQLGAMRAMVQFGSGHFTRFLERELRDPDVDRRETAALAMGQSSDEAVLPMLTMAAREDAEPAVREAAYMALGNLGSKASLLALQQLRLNAGDDDIDVIDESIAYAMDLQELENPDSYELFGFDAEDVDDIDDDEE